jgi:4-azaleucine resistance transporter AzlC
MNIDSRQFRKGIISGFPIFLGYFPIAVAFGIISKTTGLNLPGTISFSVFVFAGASQFIALNMLSISASIGEITAAVFLINLRHFLMSASLAAKLKNRSVLTLFAAFGVTDETFAVASSDRDRRTLTDKYMAGLNLTAYTGWVSGTAAGFLSGSLLPDRLKASLGILLYVMFVGILIPAVKKNRKALFTALLAGAVNIILNNATSLNSGWCIVISIITAASAPLLSSPVKRD